MVTVAMPTIELQDTKEELYSNTPPEAKSFALQYWLQKHQVYQTTPKIGCLDAMLYVCGGCVVRSVFVRMQRAFENRFWRSLGEFSLPTKLPDR